MHRDPKTAPRLALGSALAALMLAFPASAEQQGEAFARDAENPSKQWADCPEFMPEGCGIAVLQGDPAEPDADIVYRLPAGETAPRHWHNSPERMVLLTGEMEVDYDGQDPVVLTPATYAYGPARLPHSATCRSSEDCLLFIAFEEPIDAMAGAPQ